jgi:uncharacterized protein (TIGR00369 family)
LALGIEDARSVLQAQPFSVLLRAELAEFGHGKAVIEIPLRGDPDLLQQFGFVHGGVLSYAADNALTFAGGTVLGSSVVTRGFSIDYLRPARGSALRAEAVVGSHTSRLALCRCDVYALSTDGESTLCAAAQGCISHIDLQR